MEYTNKEIYQFALNIREFLVSDKELTLPIKVNFYLLKNIKILQQLTEDIEEMRLQIAQNFGVLNEETGDYQVPPEKMQEAEKLLDELFETTQKAEFHMIQYEDLEGAQLTLPQTQALMFMIEE